MVSYLIRLGFVFFSSWFPIDGGISMVDYHNGDKSNLVKYQVTKIPLYIIENFPKIHSSTST